MIARSIEDLRYERMDEIEKIRILLRDRVETAPLAVFPRTVAGADAAYLQDRVIAAVCVFTYPGLQPFEKSGAVLDAVFPYKPGFLFFREGPAIIEALKCLTELPDLILLDGHGISHPTGAGLASAVGVVLGIPSIGCAKSPLVGDFEAPGNSRGNSSDVVFKGKTVGAVLRTRDNVKPVFISPGHKIDIADSLKIVLNCSRGYRIPEPLRCADSLSKNIKKELAVG